jgi:hypothetical protein
MAKKRASLLNAFNSAMPKRVEPPPQPPRPAPTEPSRSAQPRFEARPDQTLPVRASSPVPMAPRRAAAPSGMHALPSPFSRGRMLFLAIVGATILLVVVIVLKFGAKKGDSGEALAHAGAPGAVVNAANGGTTPAAKNTANGLDPIAGQTDEDKAFLDARNKYTVRVVQYENDANGIRLARETYKYLRTEGLPAVQPIQSGDARHIYLCADAKPKKDDLAVLCGFIKRMRGADHKSIPFGDAYVDNIEHLINR